MRHVAEPSWKTSPDARLVHELFVQLAEPRAVREVDRVETAIGNRPAGDDRRHAARHAIPTTRPVTRSQLSRGSSSAARSAGYFPASIARVSSNAVRVEAVIGIRASDEREQRVRRRLFDRCDRDDALRQHVERVLRDARRPRRRPRSSPPRPPHTPTRSSRNVGTMIPRLTSPSRWPARPTRCNPAATRFGLWSCSDEIDRADVDPQLEGAGRDQRRQLAGFERALELEPPLARHRPVVRPRELRTARVVERVRRYFSACARLFTNTSVVRRAADGVAARARSRRARRESSRARGPATGERTVSSIGLTRPQSTTSTGRNAAVRLGRGGARPPSKSPVPSP